MHVIRYSYDIILKIFQVSLIEYHHNVIKEEQCLTQQL